MIAGVVAYCGIVLVILLLLGFLFLWRNLSRINNQIEFTQGYQKYFDAWGHDGFQDNNLYEWLTLNTAKMQVLLGSNGNVQEPGGQSYQFLPNALQRIFTLMPTYQMTVAGVGGGLFNHEAGRAIPPMDLVYQLRDMLKRFEGVLNVQKENAISSMKNPLTWASCGFDLILLIPIIFFQKIIPSKYEFMGIVYQSSIYRILMTCVFLFGLYSSFVTVVLGHADVFEKIKKLISL